MPGALRAEIVVCRGSRAALRDVAVTSHNASLAFTSFRDRRPCAHARSAVEISPHGVRQAGLSFALQAGRKESQPQHTSAMNQTFARGPTETQETRT